MKPRQVLAGTTYLVTRSTTQRLFLLRPSQEVNACIRYCMALAQRRSGVAVHSAVFMSNHYHIVLTDPRGTIPVFTEELNKLLTKSLNRYHGREENLWSGGTQPSQVALVSHHAVLAKTVYALANPTKAMLVSHGNLWPGVRIFRKGEYLAKKPTFFFRSEESGGTLPDRLNLTITPPPIGTQPELCDDIVQTAVSAREKQLRLYAKTNGQGFKGPSAVKNQSIYDSPTAPASRGGISPRVACRDRWRRIEVLSHLASFVAEYRERRKDFVAGVQDVVFPAGTYQMARQFGALYADH